MESAVSTHGLAKTYSSTFGKTKIEALKGVDIEVQRGEIVGILGPNGAGKTTLLKILLGVVSPTAGHASIFGKPIGDANARQRLGYLPENHRFPPYLTARQTLDVYGRLSNLDDAYRKEHIPRLVEEAGLADWMDTRVGKFSKGMMQRLGLAQATLNDPDILVLDEPTDGVDPVGRREIRDRLRVLKSKGKTILINSHLLTEIELICDRVAILNKGLIVRTGSISEIVSEGTGWRIQCRNMPLEFDVKRFGAHIESGNVEQTIVMDGGVTETLNQLIDALRSSDTSILSIEKHRKSLEAGFLDIIDEQGAKK